MKLNIRPFTDALRGTGHPWRKLGDNRLGGERLVTFGCLFRGNTEVDTPTAWAADRWLSIQLWGDGNHRVSHMFVTCDSPRDEDGCPQRLRGLTRPTDFKTPAEMLIAIQVEMLRGDHTPPPFGLFGAPLDQRTSMLVDRFAFALKEKLLESQSKYGWTDHWAKDDWQDRCTQSLLEHLAKGDPRDVAAFAAFMWHHGWSTRPAPKADGLVEKAAMLLANAVPDADDDDRDLVEYSRACNAILAALKDRDVVLEEAAKVASNPPIELLPVRNPSEPIGADEMLKGEGFRDAQRIIAQAIRNLKERV